MVQTTILWLTTKSSSRVKKFSSMIWVRFCIRTSVWPFFLRIGYSLSNGLGGGNPSPRVFACQQNKTKSAVFLQIKSFSFHSLRKMRKIFQNHTKRPLSFEKGQNELKIDGSVVKQDNLDHKDVESEQKCQQRVGRVSGACRACRARVGRVSGACRARVGRVSGVCRARVGIMLGQKFSIFRHFCSLCPLCDPFLSLTLQFANFQFENAQNCTCITQMPLNSMFFLFSLRKLTQHSYNGHPWDPTSISSF